MGTMDKRIDGYIAKARPFAQPILTHFRELVHKACPDCAETIKWGMPFFEYRGTLCNMAAFKEHCAVGFWKASLLPDPEKLLQRGEGAPAMGNLGRLTSVKDLPADRILLSYIKSAAALNEEGVQRRPTAAASPRPPANVPSYLSAALKKHPKASATFKKFSPSHKRDYIEWLTEAKTEATRERRLETAIAWMEEGKPRNWKYMKK